MDDVCSGAVSLVGFSAEVPCVNKHARQPVCRTSRGFLSRRRARLNVRAQKEHDRS